MSAIDDALKKDRWLIALDRDGTIVPYASRPEEAIVDDKLHGLISDLSTCPGVDVAIISARSSAQLKGDFDGAGVILAGNYGMEVLFPDGRECIQPHAIGAVASLKGARDELFQRVDADSGAILEDHGYSLCLHWHKVPLSRRDELHQAVLSIADHFVDLKFRRLPTSYEVLPSIPWDKGFGLSYIASTLSGPPENRLVFFAGDTEADSPAFTWTNEQGGISIRVGHGENLGAIYRVDRPQDLLDMLEYIVKRRSSLKSASV
jgi:trehalose 6-phosphate phosphatase